MSLVRLRALPKRKIAELQRRIKAGKYWTPNVGDVIYVPTNLYIDHGEDDIAGGLAMVTRVDTRMSGGDNECVFVEIAQTSHSYNWKQFLFPDQEEMMKRYKDEIARPDPDCR
jgi:hypothetical protein